MFANGPPSNHRSWHQKGFVVREPRPLSSVDEALAARYPYDPRQLPIARLTDGTMWNW